MSPTGDFLSAATESHQRMPPEPMVLDSLAQDEIKANGAAGRHAGGGFLVFAVICMAWRGLARWRSGGGVEDFFGGIYSENDAGIEGSVSEDRRTGYASFGEFERGFSRRRGR